MKLRHSIYAVLLTLPILALTACDNRVSSQPNEATQTDDNQLNLAVANAIQRDSLFGRSDITVTSSSEGLITLNGTVESNQDKNHAAEIARRVAGVNDVRNNLDVNPVTVRN